MTKQKQIEQLRKTAESLCGTLAGDWLTGSIDLVESALNSDITPECWVHGIEEAVVVRTSAKKAEMQASFQKRESELAKREAALAKRESDFEKWREEFHTTVAKTATHLEYVMDHL